MKVGVVTKELTFVSELQKERREIPEVFKEIMVENVSNLAKDIKLLI